MKTTIELPEDLLVAAKKRAADERSSLKEIFERGLRRELTRGRLQRPAARRRIRWITVAGGLPPGIDPADRERMHDALARRA